MKALIRLLSVLIVSVVSAVTARSLFDLNPFIAGGVSAFISYLVPGLPGVAYNILFAAPGGVGTVFNSGSFKGLPQFLIWNDAGNPILDLQVETKQDGVLINYVAAGLAAINGYSMVGAMPANQLVIRLANGFLADRDVVITGHTSAVGAINFNVSADCRGTNPFGYVNANVVAGNLTTFDNFTAIWLPTMAAGDTAEVNYRSVKNPGTYYRQVFNIEELAALSINFQDAAAIMIDNKNARIKDVAVLCAAATPAYIMRIKGNQF